MWLILVCDTANGCYFGLDLSLREKNSIAMEFAVDLEKEPTLEEDMAAFPDKTEEEVKWARRFVIASV